MNSSVNSLNDLFVSLASTLDGPLAIEKHGRDALLAEAHMAKSRESSNLPDVVRQVLLAEDAHPSCKLLAETPLPWGTTTTSSDPAYLEVSQHKVHVELVGPGGLAKRDDVRMGVYGMLPGVEYGIRTHPAEEIFVMLAGEADWLKGDAPYHSETTGAKLHHPSGIPHATRTRANAFMTIYVWIGDVSTDNYVYEGPPSGERS